MPHVDETQDLPIFEENPLDLFLKILERKGVAPAQLDPIIATMTAGDNLGAYNQLIALFPEFSLENLQQPNAIANLTAEYPELQGLTESQVLSWQNNPSAWLTADELQWAQSGGATGMQFSQVVEHLRPTPPATAGPSDLELNARAYIESILEEYDLGGLSQWAWDQILDGASPEMILQSMRQQQEFKDRFSGMAIRQELGLPAISPAEYISYERYAAGLMREANMPPEFWDQRQDFALLIGNDVSLNELNSRIANSYSRVSRAPGIVRDVFNEWFGTDGPSALAAFFLDPDRAGIILDQMVTQAEIGGYGRTFGINVSAGRAADIASRGVTAQEAQRGFQVLEGESAYYDETITESDDLSLEEEGVGATFGLEGDSAGKVRRRRDKRAAEFAGTGGGGVTQQGAVGLGSSRR